MKDAFLMILGVICFLLIMARFIDHIDMVTCEYKYNVSYCKWMIVPNTHVNEVNNSLKILKNNLYLMEPFDILLLV